MYFFSLLFGIFREIIVHFTEETINSEKVETCLCRVGCYRVVSTTRHITAVFTQAVSGRSLGRLISFPDFVLFRVK